VVERWVIIFGYYGGFMEDNKFTRQPCPVCGDNVEVLMEGDSCKMGYKVYCGGSCCETTPVFLSNEIDAIRRWYDGANQVMLDTSAGLFGYKTFILRRRIKDG
jgi:hypothetical protein